MPYGHCAGNVSTSTVIIREPYHVIVVQIAVLLKGNTEEILDGLEGAISCSRRLHTRETQRMVEQPEDITNHTLQQNLVNGQIAMTEKCVVPVCITNVQHLEFVNQVGVRWNLAHAPTTIR